MAEADKKKTLANPALVTESGGVPARVVIGCKLPHGLALDAATIPQYLANGELADSGERDLDERIIIKGTDSLRVVGEDGTDTGVIMPGSGGYGITVLEGKDVERWRDWYARHREYPPVKRGLIFEVGSESDARAEGEKRRDVKSGAERLDPNKLPAGIEKADTKS